jgi:hypothetical protein
LCAVRPRLARPQTKEKKVNHMTNIEHTPGPWNITNGRRDYEHAEIGTSAKTVAVILMADVEATDEDRANARLIAAAPELLEIVQAVAELRRKWRSQDEAETIDSTEYMDGLDALDVDAAIAKATAA